jgi:hypothetical protein
MDARIRIDQITSKGLHRIVWPFFDGASCIFRSDARGFAAFFYLPLMVKGAPEAR